MLLPTRAAPLSHHTVRRRLPLLATRHSHLPRSPRLFTCTRLLDLPLPHGNAPAANMSLVEEKHEWGAVRVRQTFLDYFKERGHTFGAFPSQCSRVNIF